MPNYPLNPESRVEEYLDYICSNLSGGGSSGNSIHFYKLHTEYQNGTWRIVNENGDNETFESIKAAYLDTSNFVYCISANVVMIPAFLEDQGMEFTGTYMHEGEGHLSRVIINADNAVHLGDMNLEDKEFRVDDISDFDPEDPESDTCYPTVGAVLRYVNVHIYPDGDRGLY